MILILRLGHRIPRDERMSTHCALVSRAFGADGLYYSGMKDRGFEESVGSAVERFGGDFFVEHVKNDKEFIMEKKKEGFFIVHLTMYGTDFRKETKDLKGKKKLLIIVGGEKVEPEFYDMADLNLAVGNQPHSEVGALSVFLYEINGLAVEFRNAKMKVNPCRKGKDVKIIRL